MHVLQVCNVCEALPAGLSWLLSHGVREETRAGPALVSPCPVTTVTERPCERVLFSSVRDANPFFSMYESFWMIAGRNDAAPLARFVKRFASFAEPDGTIHGAYGHRWRHALGFDQLDAVVETLKKDPTSRQCVLQMWDSTVPRHHQYSGMSDDRGSDDLRGSWKDRPCNTHAYLRVRRRDQGQAVLDLTVCCRSNDAIWGAHGANAVHFSVLQEYLAARIGVGVGTLYQVSNNYHAYLSELDRLRGRANQLKQGRPDDGWSLNISMMDDRYYRTGYPDSELGSVAPDPIFTVPEAADEDVGKALCWLDLYWEGSHPSGYKYLEFKNKWFTDTFLPAMMCHAQHVAGFTAGAAQDHMAGSIVSPDWRMVCQEWLQRRIKA
jgi:thymidylate synthase